MVNSRPLFHALFIAGLIFAALISFFVTGFVESEFRHNKWSIGRQDTFPPVVKLLREVTPSMRGMFLLACFAYLVGCVRGELNNLWFAIPFTLTILVYAGYVFLLQLAFYVVQQTYTRVGAL